MLNDGKCHCDMRTKMVGDGCSVCNPEYAADHMETDEGDMLTDEKAMEAIEALDDYARMEVGVDPIGPREVLKAFVAQQAERIAELERKNSEIAAAQRERCAKVCEDEHVDALGSGCAEDFAYNNALEHAAKAICALGD